MAFFMKKPVNILLAEDDADDRDLFIEAFALVDPAVRIETVDNGEKLMEYLTGSKSSPDCIFLDLNMPRKNGKECLQEIRSIYQMQDIPIIIYTTSLNARDIDETYHRGATCFIRKPGSFRELTSILSRYMTLDLQHPKAPRLDQNFVLNA